MKNQSKAATRIKEWRENPVKFVWDNFKVEPDAWQKDALMAFASTDLDKSRISLNACAGPGKTCLEVWCGLNFLTCYASKGQHPKGAAVAVTQDNLKDNLWPEMAKWLGRSDFLREMFGWTKSRVFCKQHPETWFISARSFSKSADSEEQGRTLSGLHSDYILYLIDESGDIPVPVLKSAEQGLTSCKWGKILQAGNPTSHDGMLYHASTKARDKWFIINITSDPDNPKRTPRVDIDWAREQIALYGRDDPWVMSYILGQFPPSSLNSLLSVEEVEAAMNRHLRTDQYSFSQKRIGIDSARFGADSWILFPRQGLASFKYVEMRHPRSEDVAARVMYARQKWGSEIEFFDGTGGYGSGAIDAVRAAGGCPIEVNFGGKADDSRYTNKRAEMWFRMAEWVKGGGALPRCNKLIKELTSVQYTYKESKFCLESKEQIRKRLGFSPDIADALALTFWMEDMPAKDAEYAKIDEAINGTGRLVSEFDPFDEKKL